MGRALKNLDGLLRMPYGCGEQNMGVLAPNIYILQYLEGTAQLTTANQATAMGYLKRGVDDYKKYIYIYFFFLLGRLNPKDVPFFSNRRISDSFLIWSLT